MLGDRSNLLPRRQEDLELPMSPIRNPSSLAFLDSKTDTDTHPRHLPRQLHKPRGGQQATGSKLQLSDSRLSFNHANANTMLPLHTSRDVSQLPESLLSFHNSQEQLSSSKHQKHIKQPPQVLSLCPAIFYLTCHNCGYSWIMIGVYRCLREIFWHFSKQRRRNICLQNH